MGYSTPMDNLKEPEKDHSSLTPGVSGESRNASYGPQACEYEDIMSLKEDADQFNKDGYGWSVGKTTGLSQPSKDQSSLRPR